MEAYDWTQSLPPILAAVCGVLCCAGILVVGAAAALWRSGLLGGALRGLTGAVGGADDMLGEADLLGDDEPGALPSRRGRGTRRYRSSRRRYTDVDDARAEADRQFQRRMQNSEDDDELDSFIDATEIDGEEL